MDLSNLRPAEGSRQSDDFRRGRGHGSGNGKTASKGIKRTSSFQAQDQFRWSDAFIQRLLRGVSRTKIQRNR